MSRYGRVSPLVYSYARGFIIFFNPSSRENEVVRERAHREAISAASANRHRAARMCAYV